MAASPTPAQNGAAIATKDYFPTARIRGIAIGTFVDANPASFQTRSSSALRSAGHGTEMLVASGGIREGSYAPFFEKSLRENPRSSLQTSGQLTMSVFPSLDCCQAGDGADG